MNNIFQGERMNPKKQSGRDRLNYICHATRYKFAQAYTKDKIVLDLGCGVGYGSKILSDCAKKVFALDICSDAIKFAYDNFKDKRIEFRCSDVYHTGIDDKAIDVVICFEVVEHLDDPQALMTEIKRILKNDGLLIISTPNKSICSPNSDVPENTFHKKEYTLSEFNTFLIKYFPKVQFFGEWPDSNMKKSQVAVTRVDRFAHNLLKLDFLQLRKLFPKNIRRAATEGLIDKAVDLIRSKGDEDYFIAEIDGNSDTKTLIGLCKN